MAQGNDEKSENDDYLEQYYNDAFESDSEGNLPQNEMKVKKTTKSKGLLQRRWSDNPLLNRRNVSKNNNQETKQRSSQREQSYVTNRLLSARQHKIEEMKNEMIDLQRQLKEIIQENHLLKRLQARQERELFKIENSRGELPDILQSHSREVYALQNHIRQGKEKNREIAQNLKAREMEVRQLKTELQKFKQLCQDKQLLDRDELQKKVENLEHELCYRNTSVQELTRKMDLMMKVHKQEMTVEIKRCREAQKQLSQLQNKYEELSNLLKDKESKLGRNNIYSKRHSSSTNSYLDQSNSPKHKNTGSSREENLSNLAANSQAEKTISVNSYLELEHYSPWSPLNLKERSENLNEMQSEGLSLHSVESITAPNSNDVEDDKTNKEFLDNYNKKIESLTNGVMSSEKSFSTAILTKSNTNRFILTEDERNTSQEPEPKESMSSTNNSLNLISKSEKALDQHQKDLLLQKLDSIDRESGDSRHNQQYNDILEDKSSLDGVLELGQQVTPHYQESIDSRYQDIFNQTSRESPLSYFKSYAKYNDRVDEQIDTSKLLHNKGSKQNIQSSDKSELLANLFGQQVSRNRENNSSNSLCNVRDALKSNNYHSVSDNDLISSHNASVRLPQIFEQSLNLSNSPIKDPSIIENLFQRNSR